MKELTAQQEDYLLEQSIEDHYEKKQRVIKPNHINTVTKEYPKSKASRWMRSFYNYPKEENRF